MRKIFWLALLIITAMAAETMQAQTTTATEEQPFVVEVFITNKQEYRTYVEIRNELAGKSFVEYGSNPNFEEAARVNIFDDYMFTTGGYISNLEFDKTYYLRVETITADGLTAYSETKIFSLSNSSNNEPPVILEGPEAVIKKAGEYYAVISFETRPDCVGALKYGQTESYGQEQTGNGNTSHQFVITGLEPGEWHYQVNCVDGNQMVESEDKVLVIPNQSEAGDLSNFLALISETVFGILDPIASVFR